MKKFSIKSIISLYLMPVFLFLSIGAQAQEIVFFPDKDFQFQPPAANFRSMRTSLRTYWNHQAQHLFELQLGDGWGLVQGPTWTVEGRAGIIARFDTKTASFFLENTDLMGGLAAQWQAGPGVLECTLYHLSAHLGGDVVQDGLREQRNVSREQAALLYLWNPRETLRIYAGPEVIVRADPAWMRGRTNFQFGVEWMPARWVAAVHLLAHGDYVKDTLDITCMTGYDLSPSGARVKQVLNIFVFRGHKRAGQYEGEIETAWGVGIYLY